MKVDGFILITQTLQVKGS